MSQNGFRFTDSYYLVAHVTTLWQFYNEPDTDKTPVSKNTISAFMTHSSGGDIYCTNKYIRCLITVPWKKKAGRDQVVTRWQNVMVCKAYPGGRFQVHVWDLSSCARRAHGLGMTRAGEDCCVKLCWEYCLFVSPGKQSELKKIKTGKEYRE